MEQIVMLIGGRIARRWRWRQGQRVGLVRRWPSPKFMGGRLSRSTPNLRWVTMRPPRAIIRSEAIFAEGSEGENENYSNRGVLRAFARDERPRSRAADQNRRAQRHVICLLDRWRGRDRCRRTDGDRRRRTCHRSKGAAGFCRPPELPDVGSAIARRWYAVEQVDAIVDIPNSGGGFAMQAIAKEWKKISLLVGAMSSDFTGSKCDAYTTQWSVDTYALSHVLGKAVAS